VGSESSLPAVITPTPQKDEDVHSAKKTRFAQMSDEAKAARRGRRDGGGVRRPMGTD